nr:MAG TPA: hypothetical protein [Bacteriophage sp.]
MRLRLPSFSGSGIVQIPRIGDVWLRSARVIEVSIFMSYI